MGKCLVGVETSEVKPLNIEFSLCIVSPKTNARENCSLLRILFQHHSYSTCSFFENIVV